MNQAQITVPIARPKAVSPVLLQLMLAVLGSVLVAVCAHVSIPLLFTPVPLTVQNFAVLLVGLLLGSPLCAQDVLKGQPAKEEQLPAPKSAGLIVPLNGTVKVQMSTKRKIASADAAKPGIARAQPVERDPTSILVTGITIGATRLTLTIECVSREDRDALLEQRVEQGTIRTLNNLAAYLSGKASDAGDGRS